MTATQIDPRLVAALSEKIIELNQLRGDQRNIFRRRAACSAKTEKAKKAVTRAYDQKRRAERRLTEINRMIEQTSHKSKQDSIDTLGQKQSKACKRVLTAYHMVNSAYDRLTELRMQLIEAEEAALQARLQYIEKEQPLTSLRYRILVALLGELPAGLVESERMLTRTSKGITIRCNLGWWHIKYDGTVIQLPMPKSSAVVTA